MSRFSSSRRQARGFTLQESLISLLIGGSLVGGGVTLHTFVRENTQISAANKLVAHLNFARSEAIKRHTSVTMCPSVSRATCLGARGGTTSWHHGWLIFVDTNRNGAPDSEEILRQYHDEDRGLTIKTSTGRDEIIYHPTGTTGGSNLTFALCDPRGTVKARYVTVSNSGRARVSRTTTSTLRCQ